MEIPVDTDKYPYKINWINRLIKYTGERLKFEEKLVLAGDFNVIPAPGDARFPEAWKNERCSCRRPASGFRPYSISG